ncbi:MAG: AraC family transcriptional regulator [Enterococcus sp.]
MNNLVSDYLLSPNRIENQQLQQQQFVSDLPSKSFYSNESSLVLLKEYFLHNNTVYISKHPRYFPYPEHTHDFLEINYVYSGTSVQYINGERKELKQGEILLLDRGSSHALETHQENDILINLIFPDDRMDLDWLLNLGSQDNILFNFLSDQVIQQAKKEYLIFHCGENQHVQAILMQILNKYFTDATFSNEFISLYLPILFTELIGNCQYDFYQETSTHVNQQIIIDTLNLIKSNYAEITLEQVAKHLGYNKNYLSNLIKKSTGKTFTELVKQERMKQAKFLLIKTKLSISEIIETIGLKNRSHFYKQFKESFGTLPSEFRA